MTTFGMSENMKPTFGYTRYGKYSSPIAVLTGRHESKHRLQGKSPGFSFYEEGRMGKDKPHALILSRPKYRLQATDPAFQNIFGWTRFGKPGNPTTVLRGRPKVKSTLEPGPGAYDLDGCDECRIGISLKGRWADIDWEEYDTPGPKYALPSFIGKGPAFSLSPKYPDKSMANSSPGPIYLLNTDKKTPKSLTFKPFPLTSHATDAGPASFNITEPAKKTFRAPPATKFAKAFCNECEWAPPKESTVGPGPGAFNVRDCTGIGPNSSNAVITSRPKLKYETSGSGKFVDLFGMTRFGPVGRKTAILSSRHFPKDKSENYRPAGGPTEPEADGTFPSKKIGIKIKSRMKCLKSDSSAIPGPGTYNLVGFIGNGPAYSLGPKYRGPIGAAEQVHTVVPSDLDECLVSGKSRNPDLCREKVVEQVLPKPKSKVPSPPPKSGNIFDTIAYLEELCTNY